MLARLASQHVTSKIAIKTANTGVRYAFILLSHVLPSFALHFVSTDLLTFMSMCTFELQIQTAEKALDNGPQDNLVSQLLHPAQRRSDS